MPKPCSTLAEGLRPRSGRSEGSGAGRRGLPQGHRGVVRLQRRSRRHGRFVRSRRAVALDARRRRQGARSDRFAAAHRDDDASARSVVEPTPARGIPPWKFRRRSATSTPDPCTAGPTPNARAASTTTFRTSTASGPRCGSRTDGGDRRHARQGVVFLAARFFMLIRNLPPPIRHRPARTASADRRRQTQGGRASHERFYRDQAKRSAFFLSVLAEKHYFAPDIHKGVPYFPG